MDSWLVLSSANGEYNYGDDIMWGAAVRSVRRILGESTPIITDGRPDWQPPLPGVTSLPFLFIELRRTVGRPASAASVLDIPVARVRRRAAARNLRSFLSPTPASRPGIRQWQQAIESSSGVVFSGAGAMTDDYFPHGVESWSAITRFAKAKGVPVAFIGQGVGPLRSPVARELAREMIEGADLFTVRESESLEVIKSLGVRSDVKLTPDWAFVADVGSVSSSHLSLPDGNASSARKVAIVAHDRQNRGHNHELSRTIGHLVRRLESVGLQIFLLPNAVGRRKNDDITYLRWLHKEEDLGKRATVFDRRLAAEEACAMLGKFDAVLATRYHALIFALSQGTPAFGLSTDAYYDQKLGGALSWYGLNSNLHRIGELEVERVAQDVHRATALRLPLERARTLSAEARGPFEHWLSQVH